MKKEITIPSQTYARGFIAAVVMVFLWRLGSLFLQLSLAFLVGMTLFSIEKFLCRHRWKRWMALTALIAGTLASFGSVLFVLIPKAVSQIAEVVRKMGDVKGKLLEVLPDGAAHRAAEGMLRGSPDSLNHAMEKAAAIGAQAAGGFYYIAVMLILAIYMLIDGPRAYRWFVAYFHEGTRGKIDATVDEARPMISSYILGQIITSALAGSFVYAFSRILKVPGALTLGLLAAVFDILPIIGFIASAVCAGALALTVSVKTALVMVLGFLAYHMIENYVLIPWIYGNRLKLSTLAVLLSLYVAEAIGGIPAMIAVLPFVAAYPAIEKIWLRRTFAPTTVFLHQKQLLESEAEPSGLSKPSGNA